MEERQRFEEATLPAARVRSVRHFGKTRSELTAEDATELAALEMKVRMLYLTGRLRCR
jgi:hypothetical protein